MKKSEIINLVVTILIFVTIPLGVAWLGARQDASETRVNAHTDSSVAALLQSSTDKFETKDAHNEDIAAVREWTKTVSTKVDTDHEQTMTALNQHSLALQVLTDTINNQSHSTTTTTTTHQ